MRIKRTDNRNNFDFLCWNGKAAVETIEEERNGVTHPLCFQLMDAPACFGTADERKTRRCRLF